MRRAGLFASLLAFLCAPIACSSQEQALSTRPNVLFIVWDTTRADRMSLYGHDRPTTPFLDRWAEKALVFENCVSTGSSTVPAHGSMFTGLLPSEHGANNAHQHLAERHETLAELFSENGYRTYCFAANPHISREENFVQGFDVVEHPWDLANQERAYRILRSKVNPKDTSSELTQKILSGNFRTWDIKACGELAADGLVRWLEAPGQDEPFFAFLNYMEAHRPFVPSHEHRLRMMTPREVELSYTIDRSWNTMWDYTLGLGEYTDEELSIMAKTYDACIAELDDLFADLIARLDAGGHLDNTVVVLTSDHGEHLGEKHMLDHQFSLYEGVVAVPLVLSYPGRVAPGRRQDPVSNLDLFPTLLGLAGISTNAGSPRAIDLLGAGAPVDARERLAEYPSDFAHALDGASARHPNWDPSPFQRRLTAFYVEDHKLIWASDGRHELYDLAQDPDELVNLADTDSELLGTLLERLGKALHSLEPFPYDEAGAPELSREQQERLEALGYASRR